MVDESRKYMESSEGHKFEAGLQNDFTKDAPPAQDNEDGDFTADSRAMGSAGQDQDSTSGMNSGISRFCSSMYKIY